MVQEFDLFEECYHCHGVGEVSVYGGGQQTGTQLCPVCEGTGSMSSQKIEADLSEQLDTIITEQAAQRDDLTAALTQIWNKVKDL